MESSIIIQLLLTAAIVFFTIWLSRISHEMARTIDNISASDEQLDEIREGIEVVATILNKLPELMPQFHMNNNPLQPLIEAFARKLGNPGDLLHSPPVQGADGRFSHATTEEEIDA